MTVNNHPFFIVGVHRSGTTLLRYMLSSNPRLYLPPESDFIPYFFLKQPQQPLSQEQVGEMLGVIFNRYRFVREWQGEPPDPATFFQAMLEKTPHAFLNLLYSRYAAQNDAVRWGDKTPIYSSYIDLLHQIFPQAKFIHIIRDGRDVALSMIDKWGQKKMHVDIYFAARNWVWRIQRAQGAGQRLGPDLFYELHYESLVADPEQHLLTICNFLGEPYLPVMAQPHRLAKQQIEAGSFHAPVRQPPSTKRISRWRQEMSPADLRLFQHAAGDMLLSQGYELAEVGEIKVKELGRYIVLRGKYEILQLGRSIFQAMNLAPPI